MSRLWHGLGPGNATLPHRNIYSPILLLLSFEILYCILNNRKEEQIGYVGRRAYYSTRLKTVRPPSRRDRGLAGHRRLSGCSGSTHGCSGVSMPVALRADVAEATVLYYYLI
jgi:hypothetical protein